MCSAIGFGVPWPQGERGVPPRLFAVPSCARIAGLARQDQLRLPGPDQIDVNFGQELGVEQCAVLGAAGIVDRIARAEIIETVRQTRMLAPGRAQRVARPFARDCWPLDALEFGVEETDVKRRVVDHQRCIGNKFQKLLDHMSEQRLVGEKFTGKTMHGERFSRHVALRVEVPMKCLPRRHAVENLDTTDFDQPVAPQRIEAGGFGIENDFAHGLQTEGRMTNQDRRCGSITASLRMSRIRARTGSSPCEVSTTKSARLRFSAAGSCRARMASSISPVMLSRARTRWR